MQSYLAERSLTFLSGAIDVLTSMCTKDFRFCNNEHEDFSDGLNQQKTAAYSSSKPEKALIIPVIPGRVEKEKWFVRGSVFGVVDV